MKNISFSICIPSVRLPDLDNLLVSLKNSFLNFRFHNYELIVCTSLLNAIELKKKSYLLPLKIVVSKKTDAALLRNTAVKKSKSQFICFLDDDVTVTADYIHQILLSINVIKNDKKCVGVVGLVKRMNNNSKLQKAWIDCGFDKYFSLPLRSKRLRWGCTANMIVKRDAFDKSGGFRQMPIPVGGEDIDFGLRLTKKGYFISNPELVVIHKPIEDWEKSAIFMKAFMYGRSEQVIGNKYKLYSKRTKLDEFIFSFLSLFTGGYSSKIKASFMIGKIFQACINRRHPLTVSATSLALGNLN